MDRTTNSCHRVTGGYAGGGEVMSTFMEHVHRNTDTLPLSDDTALPRPVEFDLAPSDTRGDSAAPQCDAPVSETPAGAFAPDGP